MFQSISQERLQGSTSNVIPCFSLNRTQLLHVSASWREITPSNPPPPFQLSVNIFIFNRISLLFHIFLLYLSCSCPYIYTIIWYYTTDCIYADPLLFGKHPTAKIITNLILFFYDYIRQRDGNFKQGCIYYIHPCFKVIKTAIHEIPRWISFLRKQSTEIR